MPTTNKTISQLMKQMDVIDEDALDKILEGPEKI